MTAQFVVTAASPNQEVLASFRRKLHRGVVKITDLFVLFRSHKAVTSDE
jgi:hypothetical protein